MELLLIAIINGIAIGGVYGLVGGAMSFQAGQLGLVNMSYGATITMGMCLFWAIVNDWGTGNMPLTILLIICGLLLCGTMRK